MKQSKINQLTLNQAYTNPVSGDLILGAFQEFDLEVHADEKTWLFLEGSRTDADKHLHGRPDGTFLVRRSTIGQYALSIV